MLATLQESRKYISFFLQEQQGGAMGSSEDGCHWYAGRLALFKLICLLRKSKIVFFNSKDQISLIIGNANTNEQCSRMYIWPGVGPIYVLNFINIIDTSEPNVHCTSGQVSDHSPCTPDLKQPGRSDFMEAWGGISSLQVEHNED